MKKYLLSAIDYSFFLLSITIGFIVYAYPLYLVSHLFSKKPRAFFQLATKHVFTIMFSLSPSIKEIKVTGLENLRTYKNFVITPTHRSFLDYLLIESLIYDLVLFTNKPLTRLWIYRHVSNLLGANAVMDNSHASYYRLFDDFKKSLEDGTNVLIFPEGTRGSSDTLAPFKEGAFKLSIISGAPILPIVINGSDKIYKKGSMLNIAQRAEIINIHICQPLIAQNGESPKVFANRARHILQDKQSIYLNQQKN